MTEKQKKQKGTSGKNSPTFWHQQGGEPLRETARQYAMFQFFLSLPPAERNSEKVRLKFGLNSARHIDRLRTEKLWNERAQAHDEKQAARLDDKRAGQLEKAATDWEAWEADNRAKVKEIADLMFAKTKEILTLPVVETTRENPIIDQAGNVVFQKITLKPTKFSASDAPRYAEAAILLSRFLVEQEDAAKRQGAGYNLHLPKPPKPLDAMSPDEVDAWIAECQAAKTALEKGEIADYTEGAEQ